MAFLTPLFLAGLGAIAIPVLIHLIQREKKRVIEFPSLMFVRRIPYQSVRRRRIRHWALLLLRAAARGRGDGTLPHERPRERRHDQRDRRRPHQQQPPMTDPPPPHGLIRNPPDEHQRGKLDDALPLPLNQVNQHGDRDG